MPGSALDWASARRRATVSTVTRRGWATLLAPLAALLLLTGCSFAVQREVGDQAAAPAADLPTSASTAGSGVLGQVPEDVLLPIASMGPAQEPRQDVEGLAGWSLPGECIEEAPRGAAAMRTVVLGAGAGETGDRAPDDPPVGVHQVAVFADAVTAQRAAERLGENLEACAAATRPPSRAVVEVVPVGAQGHGLSTAAVERVADPSGAVIGYLVTTRRGRAVTLVSAEGVEDSAVGVGPMVREQAQEAWARLCRYASSGCG